MKHHDTIRIPLLAGWLLLATSLLPILLTTAVRAEDVVVTAELNATEFPLDQAVLLTVTVSGDGSTAEPQMPEAKGLRFAFRRKSSQSQWVNGKVSSSVSFVFIVQAEKAGSFTIEPIKVTVGGKEHRTNPITCTVLPVSSSSAPPSTSQSQQSGHGSAPSARLRSGEADKISALSD